MLDLLEAKVGCNRRGSRMIGRAGGDQMMGGTWWKSRVRVLEFGKVEGTRISWRGLSCVVWCRLVRDKGR